MSETRSSENAPGAVAKAQDDPCLIGAEGTESPGEERRTGEPRQRPVDEELDAALACTFPASDPVGCLTTNCATGQER
jgi:hypothetical protein